MRLTLVLLFLALAAACKGSTGPSGVNPDPTVLVTNQTTQDTTFFNWAGSNYGGGVDTVFAGQSLLHHANGRARQRLFRMAARRTPAF